MFPGVKKKKILWLITVFCDCGHYVLYMSEVTTD